MNKRPTFTLRQVLRALALALPLGLALPLALAAQSPFSAAARVNDAIVTYFEIEQRALFLQVIRTPGDVRNVALESLVNERLQLAEARRLGVVASEAEIAEGIAEFAARAELSAAEFLDAIGQEGVAPETFRDFVANNISWRNVVQARFGARARAATSDDAVARALAHEPQLGSGQILLAELIVPVTPENRETLRDDLAQLATELNFEIDLFTEAARRFSAAPTREEGGLTGWRALDTIPAQLREDMMLLSVGETYGPVVLGPAIGIFQLRGLSQGSFRAPAAISIDYATLTLPAAGTEAGQAASAALRAEVDQCDDLYALRPGAFTRQDQPLSAIPTDIAMVLSTLDTDEIGFTPGRDGTSRIAVILCARNVAPPEGGIEVVRQGLFAAQLEANAVALLEELRADAIITYD
ncbi:peptidylprolyl isomerase [Roseicyclus sp.]|uniref:peptidylprolyl isomerase n=1 Tax=Roseicyclus sp. TaxID=1914329 RepID=UPI003F6B47DD